jgi:hypothetical protein
LIEIKLGITFKTSQAHIMVANTTKTLGKYTYEETCTWNPPMKHHNLTLWSTNIIKTLRKIKK